MLSPCSLWALGLHLPLSMLSVAVEHLVERGTNRMAPSARNAQRRQRAAYGEAQQLRRWLALLLTEPKDRRGGGGEREIRNTQHPWSKQ